LVAFLEEVGDTVSSSFAGSASEYDSHFGYWVERESRVEQ
jgi:hypothetical protein